MSVDNVEDKILELEREKFSIVNMVKNYLLLTCHPRKIRGEELAVNMIILILTIKTSSSTYLKSPKTFSD